VPVLGADSYCDSFVVDAVLDDCAEEFVAWTVDFYYAWTNWG
jgi:hypothetical protein